MAVYLPMSAKSCHCFLFLAAAFSANNTTAQSLRVERAELSAGGVKVGDLSGADVARSRWRSRRQLDVQVKLGGAIITGTIAVAGEVWGSSETILVAGVARPTRLLSDSGFTIDLLPSAWAEVFGHSPRGTQILLPGSFPLDEATIPSRAPRKKSDLPAKVLCPANLHCSCAPLALYPRPDDSTEPYMTADSDMLELRKSGPWSEVWLTRDGIRLRGFAREPPHCEQKSLDPGSSWGSAGMNGLFFQSVEVTLPVGARLLAPDGHTTILRVMQKTPARAYRTGPDWDIEVQEGQASASLQGRFAGSPMPVHVGK